MRLSSTLSLMLLCTPLLAHSTTLRGEIEGKALDWNNVQSSAGNTYVPSFWTPVNGLSPTFSWTPGALTAASPTLLTLTGPDNVTIDVSVLGFEYHMGEASFAPSGLPSTLPTCTESSVAGSWVRLTGSAGCGYDETLISNASVNPYSFIRPILELDESQVIAAFQGKPVGLYRGSFSVSSFYHYAHSNGVETRHVSQHPIVFELNYAPDEITDVHIVGDGVLDTDYNRIQKTLSGEAQFRGVAQGFFSSGLKVSLIPGRVNYEMMGPNGSAFPYSIDCAFCKQTKLVSDGSVINSESIIRAQDASSVNFTIDVSFSDVDIDSVDEGTYSDSFVLMFEPEV